MQEPTAQDGRDAAEVLVDLSRQWSAAAERAFASGLTDPAVYTRTTRLVGAVVSRLRTLGDGAEQLLGAWGERREHIRSVVASDGLLAADNLDLEAVAGAAFAMRYREVAESLTGTRRLATLAAAGPDQPWVVLEERGFHGGDPFVPYRRLEVNAAAERAILVSTHASDDFRTTVHVVEELGFDVVGGGLTALAETDAACGPWEFADAQEREAQVAHLRERHPRR